MQGAGTDLASSLRTLAGWSVRSARSAYWRIKPTRILAVRHADFDQFVGTMKEAIGELVARVGREEVGDYLEFGVYNGTSLSDMFHALRALGIEHNRLIGFDSFAGLPADAAHDDPGGFQPGEYHCDEWVARANIERHGCDMGRVHLVKGWFDDTLTPATRARLSIERASIVNFDCDIYSSSATALRFVEPILAPVAVFVFDDWSSHDLDKKELGQKRAFDEFCARHPQLTFEPLSSYSKEARIFLVTRRPAARDGVIR